MEWYLKVVRDNYANFNGRARRKEYWMFYLINILISFGLGFVLGLIGGMMDMPALASLSYIYSLAVFIPSIAVAVRRIHDSGKSGWFILIPLYNLYLLIIEGDAGSNEYGPNPKSGELELEDNLVE